MKAWLPVAGAVLCAFLLFRAAAPQPSNQDQLPQLRNLGKAFYENPTTQNEAVEAFRKARQLAPNSVVDRLNYGLALLRAGKTPEAVAELLAVQKLDPKLPHTYFNLGITYKKQGEQDKAVEQFEQMVRMVPDEPISHYNLGTLYKLAGRTDDSIEQFQLATKLDPNLAAPHFQLYNSYRVAGKTVEARRELDSFQRLKKAQEGAAIAEDVEWNAYAEVYEVMQDAVSESPRAPLGFDARSLGFPAAGAVVIDAAGTGKLAVLSWSAAGMRLDAASILPTVKDVAAAVPGDWNNDGLQDLCLLTKNSAILLANRKGKFEQVGGPVREGEFRSAVWLDYDHDYDLDLFLLGKKSVLLRNQGAAGFEDRSGDFPFVEAEAVGAVTFRLVADTKGADLLVSYADRAAILYRDRLQGQYASEPATLPAGARFLSSADINNDGFIDVLYSTGSEVGFVLNRAGALQPPVMVRSSAAEYIVADLENRGVLDLVTAAGVLRNLGGKFDIPAKLAAGGCSPLAAGDLNGDAQIDLICANSAGTQVLTNKTQTKNAWIAVKAVGIKNMKLAPGSEIEVKAGPRYQKRIYTGLPITLGLGQQSSVDTVRITWPNGLIQNEIKQPVNKLHTYQEAQRLSGSCPIVWTWNGSGFEYITDVLGVAPLGASSGDGSYFPVDHDEYIQIPGKSLRLAEGHYEVRITEELSEVAYLDEVRLIALDHPSETRVYTNDKFKSPPFPSFRLFGVQAPIRPKSARDQSGRDVLRHVQAKDDVYPSGFARNLAGVAELHHLDLDFGQETARDNRAVLVLSGWVDWADGSTFAGAAQEGKGGLVLPYLQVKDEHGKWRTVMEDMGIPAGKPKTIAVDLTGKFLSASREIRIVTNLCVYWDEIFLGEQPGPAPATLTKLPIESASLRFRGFSRAIIHPQRTEPERFEYAESSPVSLWNPTPGLYTRYGDVKELASVVDDKMIVMGSGDEVRLRFQAQSLPQLPSGWTRDFLLMVDGWAKDRDANTAYSQTTEPLPFHRMSGYPYGALEHYPDDREHQEYRRKYNTRPALRLIRPLLSD